MSGRELVLLVLQYLAEDTYLFTTPVTAPRKEVLRIAMISIMGSSAQQSKDRIQGQTFNACVIDGDFPGWVAVILQQMRELVVHSNVWTCRVDDAVVVFVRCGCCSINASTVCGCCDGVCGVVECGVSG